MKYTLIIIASLMIFLTTSCRKKYKCQCDYNNLTYLDIIADSKKKAVNMCEDFEESVQSSVTQPVKCSLQ